MRPDAFNIYKQATIAVVLVLVMACVFQKQHLNRSHKSSVVGTWRFQANPRIRLREQPLCLVSQKEKVSGFSLCNFFLKLIKYSRKKTHCSAPFSALRLPQRPEASDSEDSTASYWSRTCSTAVRRTCGCTRRAVGPSSTSWNGLCSAHLQRKSTINNRYDTLFPQTVHCSFCRYITKEEWCWSKYILELYWMILYL